MKHEFSCGAVVYTVIGGSPQYVIIESRKGIHGFPKGHMEAGETKEQTALREIREEVGLEVTLIHGFCTEDVHPIPNKPGVIKHITYFLAAYDNQTITPEKKELSSAGLCSYEEALRLLEFENSRRILREANEYLHTKKPEA